MRLDITLVTRNLVSSRNEAQELIEKGLVAINGVIVTKSSKTVTDTDKITVTERRKFVSRGGEKLEGALLHVFGTREKIHRACDNKSMLDVGASTGGFTDCLLSYGVSNVTTIDIGTNQLHEKLRADPRVTWHENTDIRNFISSEDYDGIVADLSFIPLEKVLTYLVGLVKEGGFFFLLIKPQFEVGKGNTKKGVVKDTSLVKAVLEKYKKVADEVQLKDIDIFPCTITGSDGNQEYFLYAKK